MRLPLIVASGLLALSTPWFTNSSVEARGYSTCGADSCINVRGNCVRRPMRAVSAPTGASARCRDGTFSFSQSRRGTCSHHGGVAAWL